MIVITIRNRTELRRAVLRGEITPEEASHIARRWPRRTGLWQALLLGLSLFL